MDMSTGSVDTVIMMPGPRHLFWTTGVFHLWDLGKRYRVVLVVSDPRYRSDTNFSRITELPFVERVEFLEPPGRFSKHWYYRQRFSGLVEKYRPVEVWVHNRYYPENIYFLLACREICPGCVRTQYQNGRASLRWNSDFAAREAFAAEQALLRWGISNSFLRAAVFFVKLRNITVGLLEYRILPALATGKPFRPAVNVYTGNIAPKHAGIWDGPNDKIIAYLDVEAEMFRKHGHTRIEVVEHPAKRYLAAVSSWISGNVSEKPMILVLPSYGFTATLMKHMTEGQIVARVLGGWRDTIEKLLLRYPGYDVTLKLHPSANQDTIWLRVLAGLREHFPLLQIVDPSVSAEYLIANSKVIVGDVSSTLWWACLIGGKTVISVDIFGYAGGDEMKEYAGIHYYTDIESIGRDI